MIDQKIKKKKWLNSLFIHFPVQVLLLRHRPVQQRERRRSASPDRLSISSPGFIYCQYTAGMKKITATVFAMKMFESKDRARRNKLLDMLLRSLTHYNSTRLLRVLRFMSRSLNSVNYVSQATIKSKIKSQRFEVRFQANAL